MIKAIIFDCFGVLTTDLWKEFVSTLNADDKQPARDLNRALDAGFITTAEFYEQIQKVTGRHPKTVEELINADQDKNILLLDYIKELKSKYKIGLLSNVSSDWVKTTLLSHKDQQLFDDILLSYEVKLVKPDPKIFHIACERLSVEPQECIFIDDGEYNLSGAIAVGMKTILYKEFAQFKSDLEKILNDSNN